MQLRWITCVCVSTPFVLLSIVLYNGYPYPRSEKADRIHEYSHAMKHSKSSMPRSQLVAKSMTGFSTVKKSNTNSGHSSQPRPVGRNGLLNISNNVCCLKSAGNSLEELCSVDLSKTLLDFRQADSKAEFKLKHIAVSMENGQPSDDGCTCEDYMYCRLVIVTGFSSNHFQEAQAMIASVQEHLPNTKLIVYNLGLNNEEISLVKKYCNVELRRFNFSQYPKHVSNLLTYAFKPLIIKEVTQQYEVVMWADASIRMKAHLPDYLLRSLKEFPFVSGSISGHSTVSLTHDGMLKYLNITKSRNELASHISFQGCIFLIWANTILKQHFLRYWVDCAIHPECISPQGAGLYGCNFSKENNGTFIGCHRFDQSALNMILVREFGLGISKIVYHEEVTKVLTVERDSVNQGTRPRMCN